MIESVKRPESEEAIRARIRADQLAKGLRAPEGPALIAAELPEDERGLTIAQVRRYNQLQKRLARPDLKPRQRQAAMLEIENMEVARKRAQDDAWIKGSMAETADLAQARGEDVEWNAGGGGLRVLSRGGLYQAYRRGNLEPEHGPLNADDLYAAGKRYRDAYEAHVGHTSPSGGGAGGAAPQVRVIEAGIKLAAMRDVLGSREREVLDLVCGEDIRVSDAAARLRRGVPSTVRALRGGLRSIAGMRAESAADQVERFIAAVTEVGRVARKAA